jgi:hypothetical protein
MRKLAVLSISLSIALAMLLAVTVAAARGVAVPNRLQRLGFGVCDGRPCFMGIVPGLTRPVDAYDAFEALGLPTEEIFIGVTHVGYRVTLKDTISNTIFVRTLDLNRQIERIQMDFMTGVPVGSIFRLFGAPCGASNSLFDDRVVLYYPQATITIRLSPRDTIAAHSDVLTAILYFTGDHFPDARGLCTVTPGSWKGFGKVAHLLLVR